MRRFLGFLLLSSCALFGADNPLNGRWDITVKEEPRHRAWWLEIEGAGTPTPKGKFVSAFNGDLNVIQEISIKGGEIRFGWVHTDRPREGEQPETKHLMYRARLVGDQLQGTFRVEGAHTPPVKWVGVRAPAIKDKDDGSWVEGTPLALFNQKDLSGWHGLVPGKDLGWSVESGVLKSTGGANNLISDGKFWNYKLHVQYRVGEHSNSGIGLRARYEVQILEDYGRPPNSHSNGALYSRIAPSENASKPAGEWQTYDIRLVGRQVTIVLNGKTLVDKGEIEGLTAIATDPNEGEPGPFVLQGDHGPVEFREVLLTPLVRKE